jgi:hypothetical protein
MRLLGSDISSKKILLLFILFSVISLNMTWGCCVLPAIETMKVVNKKKLNDKIKQ